MTNIKHLVGSYNIIKGYLIHRAANLKLLITTRTKAEGKKAPCFLLNKTDLKGGYISSLYYVSDTTHVETYNFDYKGIKYVLRLNKTEGVAEIGNN